MDLQAFRQNNFVLLQKPPSGFSAAICANLKRALSYKHVQHLRGIQAVDQVTGERRRVIVTPRTMLIETDDGSFAFPYGLWSRASKTLAGLGVNATLSSRDTPNPERDARLVCYPERAYDRIQFRHGQADGFEAVLKYDCGVIKWPPRVGKSIIAIAIALAYPRAVFAIVAPNVANAERMRKELLAHIPDVGIVGGGKNAVRRVTVYVINSIHNCEHCDILLGDEGHLLVAAKRGDALASVATQSRNYCLDATPHGRSDGADMRLEAIFGPIICEMNFDEARNNNLIAPMVVFWHSVRRCDRDTTAIKSDVARARWAIWRNAARNRAIAAAASLYSPDVQVLILVDFFEHMAHIAQFLSGFQLVFAHVDGETIAWYAERGLIEPHVAHLTPSRLESLRLDFETGKIKKAIATGIWNTGVNFPQLQVLIRADGRAGSRISDEQFSARPATLHETKEFGIVHDFRDQFDPLFKRRANDRFRSYDRLGYVQEDGDQLFDEIAQ